MSALRFRNVDAEPADDVRTWPQEAVAAALDRGLVPDWQPIFAEVRRSPWGEVARRVESVVAARDDDGVSALFSLAIEQARAAAEQRDRDEVARRVRAAAERSGVTQAAFAREVGTSASRLSTYATGAVTPSAAMLLRIERTARNEVSASERGDGSR